MNALQKREARVNARAAKMKPKRLAKSRLAKMRLAARLNTVEAAADRLGCSKEHLTNVELGHSPVSWALIAGMMALYDKSEDAIRFAAVQDRRDQLARTLKRVEESDDFNIRFRDGGDGP